MKGYLKGCLTSIGITVLILIVGLVYIHTHREKIMDFAINKGMGKVEKLVSKKLPEGYDEEKVKTEFENFAQALKEGRIDKNKFQDLSTLIQEISKDEQLSAEDMDKILKFMRESIIEEKKP